jgi:hypothetical protein
MQWVVEEVSRVIESGVEEKKSVAFETFSLEGEGIARRGPKSEVTATRSYTDEEQLRLVLDAIKSVLVDGSDIRLSIFDNLAADARNAVIRFEPDVPSEIQERGFLRLPEGQGEPFVLTRDVTRGGRASGRLRHAIERTKEDVSAGR